MLTDQPFLLNWVLLLISTFVEMFVVTVNGLVMEYKATPDAQDNYKIDNGGTGGVGRIVFGSNLNNSDRVTVRGFIND